MIDLLDLSGGEMVLEIGCGWGALAERLMDRHDCTVTGVTLSAEQLAFAQRRLRDRAQSGRCDLRLQDYRDVRGTFDRIVSIEMLEAVGEAYWPTYFEKLRNSLRPGGVAVLQVITIDDDSFRRLSSKSGLHPEIHLSRRHAPDDARSSSAKLPKPDFNSLRTNSLAIATRALLKNGGCVFRKLGRRSRRSDLIDRFKRTWEYYLAYCQVGFETGAINVGLYKVARSASM